MGETSSRQLSVSEMGRDERRSVEHLLGHSLQDDEQVYILAFKPGVIPDNDTRQRALASLKQTFAAAEQHSIQQGVADDEIDAAVDEAMDRIRYGKP
ncbi:MAG: hypothetical protein HY000_23650 [Planctomycetes bacterium]|nr:hypothetical protein [Planctomycetota bacterium]